MKATPLSEYCAMASLWPLVFGFRIAASIGIMSGRARDLGGGWVRFGGGCCRRVLCLAP
eukprot:CAMPEP_0181232058 /NCGR_PEP_ID=MMETSP1096-20121128/35487_1 /TAXON_ID=156174 ORGANISM="Chrysochromulina ericina, Strain CCMP281" /NCGR_SAMPLE_ID=MMETSP1096 /ASSEMBLY_ACC=CAM_ASM_000453 /LENGTH=58 /DNA_ID=CAMNT_0023326241 /DNA_START=34 /DNA_END=206 /DNA_ORIENTATION=-